MVRTKTFASALVGIFAMASAAQAQQPVAFATANPGSIYHSSGSAIAKVVNDAGKVKATIQPFGGTSQYFPAVGAGELEFGLGNVFETHLAANGKGIYKGKASPDLRAVAIMFPLRNAIYVRADSDIKSVADLKGRKGPAGYTSQKIFSVLIPALFGTEGMDGSEYEGVNVPNVVGGANAFAAGQTDFYYFALGSAKTREVHAAVPTRVLSMKNTPEALAGMQKHVPVSYLRKEKDGAAPGVVGETYVMAYDALVFASAKTPDDVVYEAVKAMHGNAEALGKAFPPLRLFDPKRMAVEIADVEYHSGAVKFYKEIGTWPPAKN